MSEQENTYVLPDERTLRLADAITGLDDDLIGEAHEKTAKRSSRRTAAVWISAACLVLIVGLIPAVLLGRTGTDNADPNNYKSGGPSFRIIWPFGGQGGNAPSSSGGKTDGEPLGTTGINDRKDGATEIVEDPPEPMEDPTASYETVTDTESASETETEPTITEPD